MRPPREHSLDYLDHMQGLIDRFGWAMVGVEGERIHAPWADALGLTTHGKPELAVTGLPLPRYLIAERGGFLRAGNHSPWAG